MFELIVENNKNKQIKLTQNESLFQIVDIKGLNPPEASIYTSKIASLHGLRYKSSKLSERNIVLTIKINGDVEKNRTTLYQFFKSGAYCKLFYKNSSKDVYCEGYVETIECGLFTNDVQMQVSILCCDPFLYAINNIFIDISKTFSNFEFPFAIEEEGIVFSGFDTHRQVEIINSGEVESGIIITLQATVDNIQNPVIYNAVSGQFLKLNITMNEGDTIIINTTKGKKTIKKIIDGVVSNAINTLEPKSTWFQLSSDSNLNLFTYSADTNEDFLKINFEYNTIYEGI